MMAVMTEVRIIDVEQEGSGVVLGVSDEPVEGVVKCIFHGDSSRLDSIACSRWLLLPWG